MDEETLFDVPVSRYREPTIFESNLLYFSVLIGMLIFSGLIFSLFDIEDMGTLAFLALLALLMAVVIGLPILLYVVRDNFDYRALFRFNPVKTDELMLVAGLAFLGYPVSIALNLVWHWLISHIGPPVLPEFPPIATFTEFLMAIIVIGIFPSVFEELMFRGIMLRAYEKLGKVAAIAITGVMFGFLHLSFASFPVLILLGIIIGYVVYRSDSVYTGMLYHFIHNSIAVTFMFFGNLALQYVENAYVPPLVYDEQMMLIGMIVWIVIGLLSAGGFVACLIAYNNKTRDKKSQHAVNVQRPKRLYVEMLPAIGGSVIILLMLAYEVFAMIAAR